jgi:hypothetical protein
MLDQPAATNLLPNAYMQGAQEFVALIETRTSPSRRTLRGLDWLNLFLADVQTGVGPFLAIYLAGYGWDEQRVGIALTVGGIAGILTQTPAGALVDRQRQTGASQVPRANLQQPSHQRRSIAGQGCPEALRRTRGGYGLDPPIHCGPAEGCPVRAWEIWTGPVFGPHHLLSATNPDHSCRAVTAALPSLEGDTGGCQPR